MLALTILTTLGSSNVALAATDGSYQAKPQDIAVEQWPGHSFTFLSLTKTGQNDGYEIFTLNDAERGYNEDRSVRIPSAEYGGKQVTVTEVRPFTSGYPQPDYMVYLKVAGTGEELVGRTSRGKLEGLVLTADLENARQYFLGKTIYPKTRSLKSVTALGENNTARSVAIKIGSPVKVVDVYAGERSAEPIWLVVDYQGEKAILPLAYSWTNFSPQFWSNDSPWADSLFIENPRKTLGGSKDTWTKIENGQIVTGMSKEQVQLSWGNPVRRNNNDSVWIYGPYSLTFSDNQLDSIDNIPVREQIAS